MRLDFDVLNASAGLTTMKFSVRALKWFTTLVVILLCGLFPAAATTSPPLPERAPEEAALPVDPLAPNDPLAVKAFDVLKRNCARCHDNRRLASDRLLSAPPVANILNLDDLARRRDLIRPGQPEASPLYVSMITRHMPYDVIQEESSKSAFSEPSASEILALRNWIAGLPSTELCQASVRSSDELEAEIEEDLARFAAPLASRRRYLSIAEIAPTCQMADKQRRIDQLQQATTKLLNQLSLAGGPMRPEPVGKDGLLLAFDLNAIGWSKEQWQWLSAHHRQPKVAATGSALSGEIANIMLPAHWLAAKLLEPGIYENLLGIPQNQSAMLSAFGIDQRASEGTTGTIIVKSKVTGHHRRIERYDVVGAQRFRLVSDFETTDTDAPEAETDDTAKPLQTRVIFPLSNGFPGFATYAGSGSRRQTVHRELLPHGLPKTDGARSGLYCLSCHGSGPRPQMPKPPGNEDGTTSPLTSDTKLDKETQAYLQALRIAGIEPSLKIEGKDPVLALAQLYTRDLDMAAAAAEMGIAVETLRAQLQTISSTMQPLAQRLSNGLVSRREFEALRRDLKSRSHAEAEHDHLASSALQTDLSNNSETPIRISLWSDKTAYADGEPVVIKAATTAQCHLTVISIGYRGNATVLYPSEFAEDNKLEQGRIVSIPAKDHGFVLRKDSRQPEHVVAICMAGERKSPPGIYHDFELQRFTLLGRWRDHLIRALDADTAERKQAGKPVKKQRRRRGRRRKPMLPYRADAKPLPQAWAQITLHGMEPSQPPSSKPTATP
ncbi:MAG: DUF4384 domain-containing protein [Filomicrobium sp.]